MLQLNMEISSRHKKNMNNVHFLQRNIKEFDFPRTSCMSHKCKCRNIKFLQENAGNIKYLPKICTVLQNSKVSSTLNFILWHKFGAHPVFFYLGLNSRKKTVYIIWSTISYMYIHYINFQQREKRGAFICHPTPLHSHSCEPTFFLIRQIH